MQNGIPRTSNPEYAELRHTFLAQTDRLLLPAYLLTGSHDQAGECFIEAWSACNNQPPTAGYAFRAAKRAVIKASLRIIARDVTEAAKNDESTRLVTPGARYGFQPDSIALTEAMFCQAMLTINVFHRAILLLRLCEGYSATDVSLLLDVSRRTLESGWQKALTALVEATATIASSGRVDLDSQKWAGSTSNGIRPDAR